MLAPSQSTQEPPISLGLILALPFLRLFADWGHRFALWRNKQDDHGSDEQMFGAE